MEYQNDIKYILVGSNAFFKGYYDDFQTKDSDYLIFEEFPENYEYMYEQHVRDICIFKYKKDTKENIIERTLTLDNAFGACKFLVPEVADILNLTVEDIRPLKRLFAEKFGEPDDPHFYVNIIFDAYMENEGFFLTNEQRDKAYESYKKTRPGKIVSTDNFWGINETAELQGAAE